MDNIFYSPDKVFFPALGIPRCPLLRVYNLRKGEGILWKFISKRMGAIPYMLQCTLGEKGNESTAQRPDITAEVPKNMGSMTPFQRIV